ncbi:MAG: hypothetical protein HZB23_02325 [Deltaproteobacteria bacterium]|nr:hypothetical protein [Deltaproteobacteria bacterium]
MNDIDFSPACRVCLIGTQPITDHAKALDNVAATAPAIPSWVQLPALGEYMIPQFSHGLPGIVITPEKVYVDAKSPGFEDALLAFYQEYLEVAGLESVPDASRFALAPEIAPGFFEFEKRLESGDLAPIAVKGQVTGPFTLAVSVTDQDGRAIFYDERLGDCAAKLIALQTRWQVEKLAAFGLPVIIFLDEPGLSGFGSSALISISRQAALSCLAEPIAAVHEIGEYCGIHVCGNTDWSLVLESGIDIVNFDAFNFFEPFAAYGDSIRTFMKKGGIIAWGIVPTADKNDIRNATVDSLYSHWESCLQKIAELGLERSLILENSLITPACGLGSLDYESAMKVLGLTKSLSERIRRENNIA